MRTALLAIVPLSFCVALAVACGGKGKPAKTEGPTPEATTEATGGPATTAEPASTGAATAAATSTPEPPPPAKKTAKEIITGGGTFMVSFADSDMKAKTSAACEKKFAKDAAKLEKCNKDAEAPWAKKGCRYEKDDKGNWWMVAFDTPKDKEVVLNKIQFKITADAPDKVTCAPEGKDMGTKPMAKLPKELVVDVPDENTIVMMDPKEGKVVYKKR